MNNLLSRVPNRYWGYFALLIWGGLSLLLLHKIPYGIDEGAARALLLVWSVSDNVVSPIVTLGFPDSRALFLVPVGILWTGNIVAAKVMTLLIMSVAAWALHAWRYRSGDAEGALLATGLLLISPLVLEQIDTISVGVYLLLIFSLGAWTDSIYRESKLAFGGMYFAQIFLCLASITLHPVGLAYPLALLWTWYKNPLNLNHRNYFFVGITIAILMAFALVPGWAHIQWLSNPIRSLSGIVLGPADGEEFGAFHWLVGIAMLIVLLLVILRQANQLWADFLGRTLLFAIVIGLLVGDAAFGIAALAILLYWGLPLLLRRPLNSSSGFWEQRGIALISIFVLSTTFMVVNKARYELVLAGSLSPRDSLIKTLAEDSGLFLNEEPEQNSPAKKPIRVASQWPGLTMLACRCDALPLPPAAQDSAALLAMLRGIDYLIFDPRNPANSSLSRNLATMETGNVETVALRSGGVILQVIKTPSPPNVQEKKI
ncbi:hypothetical protein GALL_02360 [mine drainage metagenome]|uniref:Glycosyltransferase RgtA/B/C/D-like domain-containing protein n=1 Tax=mine drainage metagenome TaxID=410659 RepID=A0A1J5TZX8_9ZZZZ